jgi:hypothetical protein
VNANAGHQEYADYLADALANSWARNLGIDGWIVDTSFQVPCAPGTNKDYGAPGGTEFILYNQIIGKVRKTQPQVVLSGEDCASWDDAIEHNFQLPGTKAQGFMQAVQQAVESKDLDTIENAVASSGADAAPVVCYLHPGLDGKQPGACPTLYYRDEGETYSAANISVHQLWVALEAASGILSEHQKSPTAVFGIQTGSWNVSADPYLSDGKESPLWAFARSRALNRLALRTKLPVVASTAIKTIKKGSGDPLADYNLIANSNCYNEGHGGIVLPGHWTNQTAASCAALCTADQKCDCVTYQARPGQTSQQKDWRDCWLRAACEPSKFEHDDVTQCYDVYQKKPRPSPSGGALVYLKHDALGPHGDAAVVLFNPGAAQTLHVDLSSLPPALLAAQIVPQDLFTNASASTPLAVNWTVRMDAGSFAAFGFHLGVFAPRKGKFKQCIADDGYSKVVPSASTLQSCFLSCKREVKCQNVFVTAESGLPRWLEKPGRIVCTLLGAVASVKASCPETGTGTLIAALSGSRSLLKANDVPMPPTFSQAMAPAGICRVQTTSPSWSEFGSRNAYTADGAVHKFSVCSGNKGPWAWQSSGNITAKECATQAKKLGAKCWDYLCPYKFAANCTCPASAGSVMPVAGATKVACVGDSVSGLSVRSIVHIQNMFSHSSLPTARSRLATFRLVV